MANARRCEEHTHSSVGGFKEQVWQAGCCEEEVLPAGNVYDNTVEEQDMVYQQELDDDASVPKRKRARKLSSQEIAQNKTERAAVRRAEAAQLKKRIATIQSTPFNQRTEEDCLILCEFEEQRMKKNNRARVRASERKANVERILAKPEEKRSQQEMDYVDTYMNARARKNQGDRLRRKRLKALKQAAFSLDDPTCNMTLLANAVDGTEPTLAGRDEETQSE